MAEYTSKGLNLASFDGGGIRGAVQLIILDHIMETMRRKFNLGYTPSPWEYFDLIGGTSTGGLNALLLGRLRMSTKDALDIYPNFAKSLFGKPKSKLRLASNGGAYTAYSANVMKKSIQNIVKHQLKKEMSDANGEEETLDQRKDACKTFVLATTAKNASSKTGPRPLSTYEPHRRPFFPTKIWEAARATSAAPLIMKPITLGPLGFEEEFIDGGLEANNPIEFVLDEAVELFDPSDAVSCIISIGTGRVPPAQYKANYIPKDLVETLVAISTNCESVEHRFASRFRYIDSERLYFRFNVEHGLQGIGLDEWNRLGEVKTFTLAYLGGVDVAKMVDEAAVAIYTRPSRMLISRLRLTITKPIAETFDTRAHPSTPSRSATSGLTTTNHTKNISLRIKNTGDYYITLTYFSDVDPEMKTLTVNGGHVHIVKVVASYAYNFTFKSGAQEENDTLMWDKSDELDVAKYFA